MDTKTNQVQDSFGWRCFGQYFTSSILVPIPSTTDQRVQPNVNRLCYKCEEVQLIVSSFFPTFSGMGVILWLTFCSLYITLDESIKLNFLLTANRKYITKQIYCIYTQWCLSFSCVQQHHIVLTYISVI